MNILVCVKQVPDTAEIKIDPVRHTLVREGTAGILNPFDGYALEAAARMRDLCPDIVITALTMGPEQAVDTLRHCLAVAADRACLVNDPAFGGSDTLATSYVLHAAVCTLERMQGEKFDLIFCGKQSVDGETAQVGPELAERLDYPQITGAVEVGVRENALLVVREMENGTEHVMCPPPCVVTFTKPAWEPRYPTIQRRLAAGRAAITRLSARELGGLSVHLAGLEGSPTRVKRTFVPDRRGVCTMVEGCNAERTARGLVDRLRQDQIV